jgi:catechol 2,3-dioxygenase-like lactoylglutathione lyase family enzyme
MTFDHIAQQVPDVAAAVTWYCDAVPGCRVLYQDASWAFVEARGTRLAFVKRGHHPSHIAWRVSDDELEQLAARHGAEIKPHRDGTRSFYIESPGGQWVEFISFPEDYPYK